MRGPEIESVRGQEVCVLTSSVLLVTSFLEPDQHFQKTKGPLVGGVSRRFSLPTDQDSEATSFASFTQALLLSPGWHASLQTLAGEDVKQHQRGTYMLVSVTEPAGPLGLAAPLNN